MIWTGSNYVVDLLVWPRKSALLSLSLFLLRRSHLNCSRLSLARLLGPLSLSFWRRIANFFSANDKLANANEAMQKRPFSLRGALSIGRPFARERSLLGRSIWRKPPQTGPVQRKGPLPLHSPFADGPKQTIEPIERECENWKCVFVCCGRIGLRRNQSADCVPKPTKRSAPKPILRRKINQNWSINFARSSRERVRVRESERASLIAISGAILITSGLLKQWTGVSGCVSLLLGWLCLFWVASLPAGSQKGPGRPTRGTGRANNGAGNRRSWNAPFLLGSGQKMTGDNSKSDTSLSMPI